MKGSAGFADRCQCHRGHLEDSVPQVRAPEPHGGSEWVRSGWEIPDRREEGDQVRIPSALQDKEFMHKLSPSWGRTHLVLYVLGSKFCHTLTEILCPSLAGHKCLSSSLSEGFPRNAQVSTEIGFLPQGALRCCHLPAATLMLLGNCFLTFNMCIAYICKEGLQNTAVNYLPESSLLPLLCVPRWPCPKNI